MKSGLARRFLTLFFLAKEMFKFSTLRAATPAEGRAGLTPFLPEQCRPRLSSIG